MAWPSSYSDGALMNAALLNALLTAAKTGGGQGTTGNATAGAANVDAPCCKITSESLTTAVGGSYTLTLTNSSVQAASNVFVNVYLGTSTNGTPQLRWAKPTDGVLTIKIANVDSTNAFNGTIVFDVLILNPA